MHAGEDDGDPAGGQRGAEAADLLREELLRGAGGGPGTEIYRLDACSLAKLEVKRKTGCQGVKIASVMYQTAFPITKDHHASSESMRRT